MTTAVETSQCPDKVHEFCESFFKLNRRQRQSFLLFMSRSQCETLRSCVFNVLLNARVSISSIDRVYLARYNQVLRILASRKIRVADKRNIIIKRAALIARVLKVVNTYIETLRAIRNPDSEGSGSDSEEAIDVDEVCEDPATGGVPHTPQTVPTNPTVESVTDPEEETEPEGSVSDLMCQTPRGEVIDSGTTSTEETPQSPEVDESLSQSTEDIEVEVEVEVEEVEEEEEEEIEEEEGGGVVEKEGDQ